VGVSQIRGIGHPGVIDSPSPLMQPQSGGQTSLVVSDAVSGSQSHQVLEMPLAAQVDPQAVVDRLAQINTQ